MRASTGLLLALPLLGAGTALITTTSNAESGGTRGDSPGAWWSQVSLAGTRITALRTEGSHVTVQTGSRQTLQSVDGGRTFSPQPGNPPITSAAQLVSGNQTWKIDPSGAVLRGTARGEMTRDPGSPNLGTGAHLIAAPAALPGVVVAVAADGTVWRRAGDGGWSESLLLLPMSLAQGVPRVTSVTAFTRPLSGAVYLSTDGYSVLVTTDGGDDWIRANPGLPDSVYALSADAAARSVYAGTSDGLWVHRLQMLPAPPAYSDRALALRWMGISLVSVAVAVAALALLIRGIAPGRTGHGSMRT